MCKTTAATTQLMTASSHWRNRYFPTFTTISMSVIDSLVSTGKIREFECEHNNRPSCIMAVTGVSSARFQDQATTAGIDNYLIKPVSLQALKALMNIA
jgi:CheY-like chemotaxis protein